MPFYGENNNDLQIVGDWFAMYGGDGNDKLQDTGNAGTGLNEIDGGRGHDFLAFGAAASGEIYGGQGNDAMKGAGGADSLYGGNGTDVLSGFGGNDILDGGVDRDLLSGDDGEDILYGGNGDDKGDIQAAGTNTQSTNVLLDYTNAGLYGGAGNDVLYGGDGDDLLSGGLGTDRQHGGDGADIFKFGLITESVKGQARDIIFDFSQDEHDRVDLSGIDAKEGPVDDQHFKFIGDNDFSGKAGELRFFKGKIQGDTDGDGKVDFQIKIVGVEQMFKGDFDL